MTDQASHSLSVNWCVIKLKASTNQYLTAVPFRVNPFYSMVQSVQRGANFSDFDKWAFVPAGSNRYWVINKATGPLVLTRVGIVYEMGDILNDQNWQIFELRPRSSGHYEIISVADRAVLSTRWNAWAFAWEHVPGDDQQELHIHPVEPIKNVPPLVAREGEPGSLDLDCLTVESFTQKPIDETRHRTAGSALVSFLSVHDDIPPKEKVRVSPYYLLKREFYWKLQDWKRHSGAGTREVTITVFQGLQTETTDSVEKTLQVKVGASGLFNGVLSLEITSGLTLKHTDTTVLNEYTQKANRFELPEGKPTVYAVWRLVNRYTLTSYDGRVVTRAAYTEPLFEQEASFPPEALAELCSRRRRTSAH